MPVSTAEVSARLGMAASAIALIFTTEYSALVGGGNSLDEVVVARAVMYLAAFGLFGLAVVPPSLKAAGQLSLAALVACLSVFYYGAVKDDEGSYTLSVHPSTHVAAEMIWQGRNPYEIRDDPAFTVAMLERFDTPAALFTRTEDGELVQQLLVYPAGHALAFVPVVAAGFTDIRWFGVTVSLAVAVLVWWAAPAVLRPVAPLLLLLHPVATLNTPVILNVDVMWVLPLMAGVLALYRRRFVWAALFYGVALSIRLHPLLLAPFLCVWLWKELDGEPAGRVRSIARLMGIALGVFLLVNLPFILWNPGD